MTCSKLLRILAIVVIVGAFLGFHCLNPGGFSGVSGGQIQSTGDIVSTDLLISFALLGLFPLIAKFVVGFIRRRKVYAGWKKPESFDYNLLVIGGGSAGLVLPTSR